MNSNEFAILRVVTLALLLVVAIVMKSGVLNKLSLSFKKAIEIILFTICGLPLLIYPLVILANVMTIAGFGEVNVDYGMVIIVSLFVLASSSYPLTYIVCFVLYFKKGNKKSIVPLIPLIHICVILSLLSLWGSMEKVFKHASCMYINLG